MLSTTIDWLRVLDILTKIGGAIALLWLVPKGVLALIRWRRSQDERKVILTMTRERADAFALPEREITQLTHLRTRRVRNALFRLQEKGRVRFGNNGWNLAVPAHLDSLPARFKGRFT
jgi:hypothetical protein